MSVKESDLAPGGPTTDGGLQRGLKSRHLQLIALGGIIGSGYFLGTGYVIDSAGPAATLAYLLGGLIVLCVMLCMGELAVAIPISGSFVTYANDFISPAWACGMGWSYWLTWVFYVPAEMIAAGIIMNNFFPAVDTLYWAIGFGLIITVINLSYVGTFGELEFWLAIIKIMAIIMFVVFAALIFLGVIGGTEGFKGTTHLLGNGGFAPKGSWAILLTMVIILVNFQGSEIIGLAAGESKEPEKTIPLAIKNVTWRIIALYIVPLFLLVCIFPWGNAGLEESVFAAALNAYGFHWAGGLFSFVVLTAAISCSNSGLYGGTRAVYALAREGMAPKFLGKLNKNGVPQNATLLSIAGCWICVLAYTFDSSEIIFTYLLALSGFAGAIAWISICWSQLNFRRKLEREGFDISTLKYRTPFFPYLTHFAIWVQVACLGIIAFNEDLRISLYIGLPLLIFPIIWYKIWGYKLKPLEVARIKYEDVFVK
ncbi:amino acid permease [Desulforamulus aeronauticus]|uniref:Amino acid/polyamine/organocation transporter, APC superfamily n=1 Tax=Desulforamulus aeronauticus DSM 10349 TaxID=1121421 RepID=A0A1M6TNA4_9FIRM|nr:amino acid permease [Desulforamulus aeronauticus]SHK58475.1 amino acid/polyamine/organocation transporter, APC superfamily [Desulforamulus aeronauticus DSM 10349]